MIRQERNIIKSISPGGWGKSISLWRAHGKRGSDPFFVALYQAFKVLGYIRQNKTFSQVTVKPLRIIKYCAIAIISFVAVSVIFIMFADKDDRPAGVFMRDPHCLPFTRHRHRGRDV
jgi:hypothetical protein